MSYIVPQEIPQSCYECPFCCTKWYHPFWAETEKAGTKGLYCQLDAERKILKLNTEDKTTKAKWCPLVEVK